MPENSGGREGHSSSSSQGINRGRRRHYNRDRARDVHPNDADYTTYQNNGSSNGFWNEPYFDGSHRGGYNYHQRNYHQNYYNGNGYSNYSYQPQPVSRNQHTYRRGSNRGRSSKNDDPKRKEMNVENAHGPADKLSDKFLASPAVETQATSLRHQIESNSYECMVCYDTINAFCAVYSCFQCYNIFHLSCIRQWASSKLSEEGIPEGTSANWTCPACQVSSNNLPYRYICFCGSVINPKFKSFVLPHSCGEKCTRIRSSCSHSCPELCHPGKCPPCPASVIIHCSCLKESKRVKCSQRGDEFRCSKTCNKFLNCGKHYCKGLCHSGSCDVCLEENVRVCYCGQSTKNISCGYEAKSSKDDHTGFWSCNEKCNQVLSCGNHSCSRNCHPDACLPCENDVDIVIYCPCGKTKLEKLLNTKRQSCLDGIPTCKKVCKKALDCGDRESNHICQSLCHSGVCPLCSDRSLVMCNCKSSTESMNCFDIPSGGLKCEKVCYKKKSCGRHRCNTKCCLEDNHICMIPCGKLLSCKTHKCDEFCHRGHCMSCLLSNFSEVYCSCGRTKLEPPVACGTPPPKCNEICNRDHICGHPVSHACHYDEHCPPCAFLVNKVCMGGHAVRFNIPCHVVDVSCGEMCRKRLQCGIHTCQQWCHKGDCIQENKVCELPCAKVRQNCLHQCKAKCHVGKPCPQTVCFDKTVALCECGRRKVDILCFKGATKLEDYNPQLTRYNIKLRSSGFSISQQDLIDYLKNGKLQCVENCHVEERNQKFAEGLGLVDVPVDALTAPSYSEYLKSEIKLDKGFVIEIEEEFGNLIEKYKKRNNSADVLNKVKFIYHDFNPMNKDKRRIIHELATFYKIGTQSFDDDPVRNIQLKISWESNVPTVRLSQYFQKRVIGGVTSNALAKPPVLPKPEEGEETPNLQSLNSLSIIDDIVFDCWEDIN